MAFDWNHSYGPLDWPRDGTEMLRIKARKPSYWKAANLDYFDGLRWLAASQGPGIDPRSQLPAQAEFRHPDWVEHLRVTVRSLRSRAVIGAGTTLAVRQLGRRPAEPGPSAGTFDVTRALGRGDSYKADVYTPRPAPSELVAAGTDYPGFASLYLNVIVPPSVAGGVRREVAFAPTRVGATACS